MTFPEYTLMVTRDAERLWSQRWHGEYPHFRNPQVADLHGPTALNGNDIAKSPLHPSTSTSMNAFG